MSNHGSDPSALAAIGLSLPCGCTPTMPCRGCLSIAGDWEGTNDPPPQHGAHAGKELLPVDKPPPAHYDVDPETGCWVWNRNTNRHGYGLTRYAGRQVSAHRAYFAHYVEPLPARMVVMHTCDRPSCVNPEHLRLGTQADNHADSKRKGRQVGGIGMLNRHCKLTELDVAMIRALAAQGVRQKDIAPQFGIQPAAVSQIVNRRRWADVA